MVDIMTAEGRQLDSVLKHRILCAGCFSDHRLGSVLPVSPQGVCLQGVFTPYCIEGEKEYLAALQCLQSCDIPSGVARVELKEVWHLDGLQIFTAVPSVRLEVFGPAGDCVYYGELRDFKGYDVPHIFTTQQEFRQAA